ncbi:hypothetical protein L596_007446 [Steinernema carpocapsae]|uniref:Uncharacterized protein n=1 Tax=Steinernema carpocapsae TaxID=34508 RepID=A0A4U5P9D5_STECR|nr:hypothetical protein L596_007446 [Steinernema carpocapsae]
MAKGNRTLRDKKTSLSDFGLKKLMGLSSSAIARTSKPTGGHSKVLCVAKSSPLRAIDFLLARPRTLARRGPRVAPRIGPLFALRNAYSHTHSNSRPTINHPNRLEPYPSLHRNSTLEHPASSTRS